VPLNTASADELAKLPGVSPRLAAQIVADRAARGPYGSLKDLSRVRGVSASLLKRLQTRLAVP
jgi:competence protein ComEA